jgi:NitT/TauT family transport system permease protein
VPFGLWAGRSPRVEAWIDPWLDILLVLPLAALGPLVIIACGVGLAARTVIVGLFAAPVIAVNAITALRNLKPGLMEMAQAFGATRWQLWWRILLPSALPGLLTGLRIGLSRALTGMVIAELLVVAAGVGGLLLEYQSQFDAGAVYGVAVVVMSEAVLLTRLAGRLERRVTEWATGVQWA